MGVKKGTQFPPRVLRTYSLSEEAVRQRPNRLVEADENDRVLIMLTTSVEKIQARPSREK